VQRSQLLTRAGDAFGRATSLDAGFREAWEMKAVAAALSGQCDVARASMAAEARVKRNGMRSYPFETGTGDQHSGGLRRRRLIEKPQIPLDDDISPCENGVGGRG
jgi:hypothetical protein